MMGKLAAYPLVSVVIPVYNSERTLDACLQSVLSQSYPCLEVIVVDDCSKDRSSEMIQEYAHADSRVRTLGKRRNEGLVRARQSGVELAKGKYIQYLDSDDTLREDALRHLVERAEETQADMVVAPFYFCTDGKREKSLFFDFDEMSGIEYLRPLLTWKAHWCVWSKFHLRTLYAHVIERPEISLGEDVILSAQLLFHARKVVCIPEEVVDYYFAPSSMSHPESFNDAKYRDFNAYVEWLNQYLRQKDLLPALRREMAYFNLRTLLMRLHWQKIDDVDKRVRGALADMKRFPELGDMLSRRERKILTVYRYSRWLGYWNLRRYQKQGKL